MENLEKIIEKRMWFLYLWVEVYDAMFNDGGLDEILFKDELEYFDQFWDILDDIIPNIASYTMSRLEKTKEFKPDEEINI